MSAPLMSRIVDMTWSRALILSAVMTVLYGVAVFDNGDSFEARKSELQTQLAEAQSQLDATKTAMADAARFEQEVLQLQQQFERIAAYMPKDLRIADLTTMLYEQAEAGNVKISRLDPKSSSDRGPFYEHVRIEVSVEGSFAQIVGFLSMMSKVQRLLTFEGVELSLVPSTNPAMTPKVAFKGLLVGYRYNRQVEVDPAMSPEQAQQSP